MLYIVASDRLYLPKEGLSDEVQAAIIGSLTIPNPEKPRAQREMIRDWELMSDTWELYEDYGKDLVLPRGYMDVLLRGLKKMGVKHRFIDAMTRGESFASEEWTVPALRPLQIEAAEAMGKAQQGILEAPTGCVVGSTMLSLNRASKGFQMSIEKAYAKFNGLPKLHGKPWQKDIPTFCRALKDDVFGQHLVEDIVYSGEKPTIEITLESGKSIGCTREHKILSDNGWVGAGDLAVGDWVTVNGLKKGYKYVTAPPGHHRAMMVGHRSAPTNGYVLESVLVAEKKYGRPIMRTEHVHHIDENPLNNDPSNLEVLTPSQHNKAHRRFRNMDGGTAGRGGRIVFLPKYERVLTIKDKGVQMTYDMVMQDPYNMMLEVIRRLGMKSIIIVDKTNIAKQWADRASEHFGAEVGIIGDGQWDDSKMLTIALQQSLWSRREELEKDGFFKRFGFAGLDECHHATADTLQYLFNKFPAVARMGCSATPDRDPETFPLLTELIGGVVYEMPDSVMKITPSVEVVRTDFSYNFQPTQKISGRIVRNNYAPMMGKLTKDGNRNVKIAMIAIDEAEHGHRVLITSRQKGHLELIGKAIFVRSNVHPIMLTGDQTTDERMEVGDQVAAGPCIVLSTIADEALDMPAFDRIILAFPTRKTAIVQQQVGRVRRDFPGKTNAVVYDILDQHVGVLKSQFKDRRRDVYNKLKMPVNI
jgi:superfamily II DNA or RNA helicase